MKKGFLCICLFFSCNVNAIQNICLTEDVEKIKVFEQQLADCRVKYSDNISTADMNNVTYESADCAVAVAYEIFERFYVQNNKQSTEIFDALVTLIYQYAHNLKQGSDAAKEMYSGTMYNTEAIIYAESIVHNIVLNYLKEIKMECADFNEWKN